MIKSAYVSIEVIQKVVECGDSINIELNYGLNTHHMIECIFKGFARALRRAFSIDRNSDGVPSTKGSMF